MTKFGGEGGHGKHAVKQEHKGVVVGCSGRKRLETRASSRKSRRVKVWDRTAGR